MVIINSEQDIEQERKINIRHRHNESNGIMSSDEFNSNSAFMHNLTIGYDINSMSRALNRLQVYDLYQGFLEDKYITLCKTDTDTRYLIITRGQITLIKNLNTDTLVMKVEGDDACRGRHTAISHTVAHGIWNAIRSLYKTYER